ncbi:hypothetical protein GQX73_g2488 [Xylaria multiplex]|uniref:Protein kinase domain-containing protein n=1 Tax=Xylaria multiplex TaxID=323545 RepID=A0A7C8N8R6_9PEZI|nr:hypothetical protein GQX73_g2488 [Xylaria multiplex]
MAAPTKASPPLPAETNRLGAFLKKFTGKGLKGNSPPAPRSEPGLSRDSSVSSGRFQKARRAIPGLPRAKTFKRQLSENRDKLEANLPTPAERRAVSVDRRMQIPRSASHSSLLLPRASAHDFFVDDTEPSTGKLAGISQTTSAPQSPIDEKHFLSLNAIDIPTIVGDDGHTDEQIPTYPEAISITDAQSINTCQYDAEIREELEHRWILNLSMHFRDKSRREKFFVTFREKDSIWRRVTISLDYRNAPMDSLEKELLNIKFQRDKSAKIYESIRESLQDIQFYDTVTNLKLQTADGRLHVHVVEDVNEIIQFPSVQMVQHMGCRRVRESELEFDSHMSGFVYKVRSGGRTLIKKEIPGPDTIDEFLYEVNALNSLRFSKSIIEFYGVVVDDYDQVVKGLLISYAEKGALIDVIYDSQERGDQELPWAVREKWARQIVQGLSDIHETGFVQGDFTLSNIVIDNSENAKIIDINRRGCPVGWEPPEATPLIDSNQRISMYIGVKSDLYQLGMVLWALATLEDEPEAHRRPLRLKAELDVPSWYRAIVENCLHENPRFRLQATALLEQFPEIPYDIHEEQGLPSISVPDGTSFQKYATGKSYNPPDIINAEFRNSWHEPSVSNTHTTSPSYSDELDYPLRGRSPPSPLPNHHDLYSRPHIRVDANWGGPHDIAADDDSTADEAMVGAQGDLENMTMFAKMTEELEQMEENFRAEAALKDEQTQKALGGNSPAQEIPSKTFHVEPVVVADSQDENAVLLNEDEADVRTPVNDITPDGSSEGTPVAEDLYLGESTASEESLEEEETHGKPTEDDNVDVVIPSADDQAGVATAPNFEDQAKSTTVTKTQKVEAGTDHLGTEHTHDRTDDKTENTSTRPTEASIMTKADLASQKDSPLSEPSGQASVDLSDEETGEQGPPVYSDKYPGAPATEAVRDAEVAA